MMRLHALLERTGRRFWPIFAGVLVVEAQKRLYQGLPVAARASRRVFVPVLAPQGATTRNADTSAERLPHPRADLGKREGLVDHASTMPESSAARSRCSA
jgi:hypothetical protein